MVPKLFFWDWWHCFGSVHMTIKCQITMEISVIEDNSWDICIAEHLSTWPSDNPTMWPSGIQIWSCDCLAMCACHHIMTWSCATCDQQITWSSDHLAIWPSDHQTIQSFEHLSIYASEHLSTYAGEHLAIWPSHHMTVWASAYPTIWPPHGMIVAGPCQNAHVHIHWCAHVHNEFYTLIHIHWMSNRQPLICIHVLFHPRSCAEAASIKAILCTAMQCCPAMYLLIISTQRLTAGFQSPRCTLSQLRCHVYLYN